MNQPTREQKILLIQQKIENWGDVFLDSLLCSSRILTMKIQKIGRLLMFHNKPFWDLNFTKLADQPDEALDGILAELLP